MSRLGQSFDDRFSPGPRSRWWLRVRIVARESIRLHELVEVAAFEDSSGADRLARLSVSLPVLFQRSSSLAKPSGYGLEGLETWELAAVPNRSPSAPRSLLGPVLRFQLSPVNPSLLEGLIQEELTGEGFFDSWKFLLIQGHRASFSRGCGTISAYRDPLLARKSLIFRHFAPVQFQRTFFQLCLL